MAYVPRAMRQRSAADRHEELHGADLAIMRRLERQFGEQAMRERIAHWPVLDASNVDAAIRFQETRAAELRAGHAEYRAALTRVVTFPKGGR